MNKDDDDTMDKELTTLIRAAEATFANAEELFVEAELLTKAGHLSRALFLHQISMEECGKVEMLGAWITSVLAGIERDGKKFWKALASHKAKNAANAYMLELSEEEKEARERGDWKGEGEAFKRAKLAFHEKSNTAKNAALYVDVTEQEVSTPQGSITAEMVAEIAAENEKYLGLMYPKIQMLRKWEKEPGEVVEQLTQFMTRMEQLREEMPDDPRKALATVMDEMLTVARKKAQLRDP